MRVKSSRSELLVTGENISHRKKPSNLDPQDTRIFEHEFIKPVAAGHVLQVADAVFVYDGIFDRMGNFLSSYTHPKPVTRKYLSVIRSLVRHLLLFKLLGNGEVINKAIWITDNWSGAYFHWLTESIPRLLASRKLIDDHVVILPSHLERYPFISQSLSRLRVPFRFLRNDVPVRINQLLVTSHIADAGNYYPGLMNEMRDTFVQSGSRADRRIFISRRKSKNRTIANENEVANILRQYQFEIHCFEDYTFDKQLEIMSESNMLIGLHGAGLTNMIFMKKDGQLLELRDANDSHNNCYFSLASDLDINYYYLLNQAETDKDGALRMFVDLERLKSVLNLMLNQISTNN